MNEERTAFREAISRTYRFESEFARRIGWSRQKLSKTILGQRKPKLDEVRKISDLLGISVDAALAFFVPGEETQKPEKSILTGQFEKIVVFNTETQEEIAVITAEAITTARDNIAVQLTPRQKTDSALPNKNQFVPRDARGIDTEISQKCSCRCSPTALGSANPACYFCTR